MGQIYIADPGSLEGINWNGSGARIDVSPLVSANGDGYLRLINDGGVAIQAGAADTTDAAFESSGDFYVDTDTLFVDASADRIGIGTNAPGTPLDVVGGITTQGGSGGLVLEDRGAATDTFYLFNNAGLLSIWEGTDLLTVAENTGNTSIAGRLGVNGGTSSVAQLYTQEDSSANLTGATSLTAQFDYTDSSTGTTTSSTRAALQTSYTKSGSGTHTSWNGYNINAQTNLNAGSIALGLLVAAITTTLPLLFKPSIIASN